MWRACLVLAAACGRVGFAPLDPVDGDSGTGDGNSDGPGVAPRCGASSLLSDDFSGPLSAAQWGASYEDVSGMRQLTGGQAQITLQSNVAGNAYAAYATERAYDLTGKAVAVETTTVPSPDDGAELLFFAFGYVAGEKYFLELGVARNMLRLRLGGPSTSNDLATVPYDASAHRFMRIREEGGTLHADVSRDGQSWNQIGSTTATWDPTLTQFSLTAGTYMAVASPGVAAWNSINAGVTADAGFCPIDTATGSFADGMLEPGWLRRYGPATCTETGGKLVLSMPATMTTSCELASKQAYDLTGSAIVGEITATTAAANTQTRFGIAHDTANNVSISEFGGLMMFEVYINGIRQHVTTPGTLPPYNATNHRRWRIRHEASSSTFIAELGTASGTYVELDRYSTAFPTDSVYITFQGDNTNAAVSSLAELSALNP